MDCQLNPSGDGKDYLSFQPLLLSSPLVNTQINLQAASDTGVGLNPRDLDLEPTAAMTPLTGMLQHSPQRDVPADVGSQDHLLSGGQGGLRKDGEELAARMVPNAAGGTAAQITVTGLDRTGTDRSISSGRGTGRGPNPTCTGQASPDREVPGLLRPQLPGRAVFPRVGRTPTARTACRFDARCCWGPGYRQRARLQ